MQEHKELEQELKELMIRTLALEDVRAEDIKDDQELLSIGLGLDSIDILELIMALRRKYGLEFSDEPDEIREHFASVRTLAAFVREGRQTPEGGG